MSKLHFNTMVRDEEDLLAALLPIWKEYPIDKFVFYDDGSTDSTVEVIKSFLPESRRVILNDGRGDNFSESHNRSRMFEYSRGEADFVFSIDADELLSSNILTNIEDLLKACSMYDLKLYWYNVVDGTLSKMRQDPAYRNNFRTFILPVKSCGTFDLSQWKYHTPRTPPVNLPQGAIDVLGVIHLQAINRRYYALKQLWYKHHELVKYGHSVEEINSRYDPVVNGMDFQAVPTPENIINGISFDASIYDNVAKKKGYLDFILKHYNERLVTFGQEYVKP